MELSDLNAEGHEALQQALGYLNFASGASDAKFLANLNQLYSQLSVPCGDGETGQANSDRVVEESNWRVVGRLLGEKLDRLVVESPAFSDSTQARAVLNLVLQHVIPGYRQYHRDLLYHQSDQLLFGPFMFGRICQAVLSLGPPWEAAERISQEAILSLNDYIGHRPVAALETRKLEPYAHEWTRPIPLYVKGAGVAVGPYQELIQRALFWLGQTEEDLLEEAYFDLERLEELALDGRAHDFEHPVNKRPNYHFGQWDPHCIDERGDFRRFVVHQVVLDAFLQRVNQNKKLPRQQLLEEAACVLGGTILMGSGISGRGPDTHDSATTLATLLPRIAGYRDRYYERLVERFAAEHAERLREEAARLHQPLGAARQNLNAELAQCRASQLGHVKLANIFARIGHPAAAKRQAQLVPAASARMRCQIDCALTMAEQAIHSRALAEAAANLQEVMDVLRRAIQCGAIVDPWNILGFDAHFSLFPALENSVHDHRIDELIVLVDRIFALHARLWSEAAAADDHELSTEIASHFKRTATWWNQFAAHELQSVDAVNAMATYAAADKVAQALNLWHKGGAAAGDIAFWAPHAEMFQSPSAYSLTVQTLLDRGDHVASMALLMHWLSRAGECPLGQPDGSFHHLAHRWLLARIMGRPCRSRDKRTQPASAEGLTPQSAGAQTNDGADHWSLIAKFFDFLEANADQYWNVPPFGLACSARDQSVASDRGLDSEEREQNQDESNGLFSAAYEGVVYRDSTDDGVDGAIFHSEHPSDEELEAESDRIVDRLAFLDNVARLWKMAALAWSGARRQDNDVSPKPQGGLGDDVFGRWCTHLGTNRQRLFELLDAVETYPIAAPTGDHDSMLQYDRRRLVKEALLDQIIATCVEIAVAEHSIVAARMGLRPPDGASPLDSATIDEDEQIAIEILCDACQGDVQAVRKKCSVLFRSLGDRSILHVPLAKGGSPRDIVSVQIRQRTIATLLEWLPRLGLLTETRQLLDTAREMERNAPIGPGAVTQFDELFELGYRALVQALVRAAEITECGLARKRRRPKRAAGQADADYSVESDLVDCLEQLTQCLLAGWLAHSRTLRLSVIEKVMNQERWRRLVKFIKRYGADIFTQPFLNLSNLRAILHQGVGRWLNQLQQYGPDQVPWQLVEDLGSRLDRREATEQLSLILEAITENYAEYRDYNSTTTQSDQGDMLHTLLDFLRLRVAYDRVVWNLKPVILSHEILVRRGRNEAAQLWRRALHERINDEADRYLERLARLQKKHAMRLATVADRLSERFLRTLSIDRMRALVEPAMRHPDAGTARRAFEILEEEAALLMRDPTGVGLDWPTWLIALEEEVDLVAQRELDLEHGSLGDSFFPSVSLTLADVHTQIDQW